MLHVVDGGRGISVVKLEAGERKQKANVLNGNSDARTETQLH